MEAKDRLFTTLQQRKVDRSDKSLLKIPSLHSDYQFLSFSHGILMTNKGADRDIQRKGVVTGDMKKPDHERTDCAMAEHH